MTTRPLDLTQRQVRAIAAGAKKAGCIAVVERGETRILLVPKEQIADFSDVPLVVANDRELEII